MTAGIIDAVDPNAPFVSKELAVVARQAATVRNTGFSLTLAPQAEEITRKSLDLLQQLSRVPAVIADDETYANAGALLGVAKKVLEQAEASRKAVTKPVLDLKGAVDAVFAAAADGAHTVKQQLSTRLSEYLVRKRASEDQAARDRQAAIDAETQRLAAEALAAGNAAAAIAIREAGAELKEQAPTTTVAEAHGIKTGAAKVKNVIVTDIVSATKHVLEFADPAEATAIIKLSPGALKEFLKRRMGGALAVGVLPGIEITESDVIRNF